MAQVDVQRRRLEMHRLAVAAGFDGIAQRQVDWPFRRTTSLILTVGRLPAP